MGKLASITEKYQNDKIDDLRPSQLEDLQAELKGIYKEDITSLSDAKTFLDLLGSFRKTIARVDKLNGEKYVELIRSILSVGEDGVYSDPNRFLYELIQNVDDCEYNDLSECKLNITFDIVADLLIMEYNEKGFEPFNVYAITGIAERAKNVDEFKKEIGEKGIGFKSVFGVADKVLIQSGVFSFEINKENFTIPIPVYDNYKRIEGTKLTIYLPKDKGTEIYNAMVERYCEKDAIFNKNPLLFLNKLTELNFYVDGFRYMKFNVTRPSECKEGLTQDDITLSVELKDPKRSSGEVIENSLNCIWFSKPVSYDKYDCKSRYGEDTSLTEKCLTVAVVVPKAEDISKVACGTLYSYLPTQIKMEIPAAIHVPFKLDASREFVAPQNNNSWFAHSHIELKLLLKEVYTKLADMVKEQIVYYLSRSVGSIFGGNSEKVNCLKNLDGFKRENFLELPVFCVEDGEKAKASEIICISAKECSKPKMVYKILGYTKKLFIPPEDSQPKRIGLEVVEDVNKKVLDAAFGNEKVTKDALDYLCSLEEFPFNYKDINKKFKLTASQVIEIVRHKKVYELFKINAKNAIKDSMRPEYSVSLPELTDINENLDFKKSEIPEKVEKYLNFCKYKYILIDCDPPFWFAAHNALVLSTNGAMDKFTDFCLDVDKDSLFALNQKIKKASQWLNDLVNDVSVSDTDYLLALIQIRKSVKNALGDTAYKNYVDIVNKSGADNLRFVNELLQNADDCTYAEGIVPEFLLIYDAAFMKTYCNEIGFDRANVRAITSIGDSTKTKLLNKEDNPTGEKGIGFKTVFSVAKDVTIISGGFYFNLTAEEPTIPQTEDKKLEPKGGGTSMIFTLKKALPDDLFTEEKVLNLCLCLRKLKKITLGNNVIEITDSENIRTIMVNGTTYSFSKITHKFEINDRQAIDEREQNDKNVNHIQCISCYVYAGKRDKTSKTGILYNVLPTGIAVKVPMFIDAPLMLTTSRDHVLDNNRWNQVILDNVYKAIEATLLVKKNELRSGILDLIGIGNKRENSNYIFYTEMFSDKLLNRDSWINSLKLVKFLPTYDKNIFVCSNDLRCKRYPAPANYLLGKGEQFSVPLSQIIDVRADEEYNVVLNALGIKFEEPESVLKMMLPSVRKYMEDGEFVRRLHPYLLKECKGVPKDLLRKLPIIPVYPRQGEQADFVCWQEDKIFVKDNADRSEENYYVLNESLLSKSDCESMFSVNIYKRDFAYEQSEYRKSMNEKFSNLYTQDLYSYILSEYNSYRIAKFGCIDLLKSNVHDGKLPLKNVKGEVVLFSLFINDNPDFVQGGVFDSLSVHEECIVLAKEINTKNLSDIYYGDIVIKQDLTADDIEALMNKDWFKHGREILEGFVNGGYVSDELIERYNLGYLTYSDGGELIYDEFPCDPVKNMASLCNSIKKSWDDPFKIVGVTEEKTIYKKEHRGEQSDINNYELRNALINRYGAQSDRRKCFCQMCKKLKDISFIEVNNIEYLPEYYWEQMRVALCLECSKTFEMMRNDKGLMEIFRNNILDVDCCSDEPVCVSIDGYKRTMTFTQTHLAEIQEILKLQNGDK